MSNEEPDDVCDGVTRADVVCPDCGHETRLYKDFGKPRFMGILNPRGRIVPCPSCKEELVLHCMKGEKIWRLAERYYLGRKKKED